MRKNITTLMILSIFLLGACAGREAEPIRVVQNDDAKKNCAYLVNEIEVVEFEIERLIPKKDKLMKNAALGVAGLYTFFIPWMLMDFKNAEAKEYKSLRMRHEHLVNLATEKECTFVARSYPSEEEVKREYMEREKAPVPLNE